MVRKDSLKNIRSFSWPYKHALIHDFFSSNTYALMLRNLPHYSQYTQEQNRYEFWLNEKNLKALSPKDRGFWNNVHKDILTNGRALFDTCTRHLDVSGNDSVTSFEQCQLWVRLVREPCPFILSPHLDMHIKSFVIVVYLAPDEQFSQQGTTLYKKVGPYFLPLKRLPYIPNLATIIPRTKHAWHGGLWNEHFHRNTLHIYFTHLSDMELQDRSALHCIGVENYTSV